jgi:glycosyltransferase involved in cell wall biosynthesis
MIDIVIPTYNRSELLNHTLSSILKQSVDKKMINVFVVDDGSADDSERVAKEYSKVLNLHYFYQEDKGYRVASARNTGLKNGTSDICLLIDSGILLRSDCVKQHLDLHRRNPDPIAVIGYVYGFDDDDPDLEHLQKICAGMPDVDEIIDYLEVHKLYLDVREVEYSRFNGQIHWLPAPWVFFWTGHVSFNRKCLKEGEFFDVIFEPRYGFEDMDLGYRMHCNSIKMHLLREAKVFHFPHRKLQSYDKQTVMNQKVFQMKYKNDPVIRQFEEHGGMWGFNDFLLEKQKYGVPVIGNNTSNILKG